MLVRRQKDREKLAEAMMDSNARKVKEAPVVAVFAADCGESRALNTVQTQVDNSLVCRFLAFRA